MTREDDQNPTGRLAEIFARINMSELPAMSSHVRELLSITCSKRSASYELARVILKDYSLTNKVLQVVNSAYYALGRKVSSISRAVTILGFDAIRELATGIALFEDFLARGVDKEGMSKVLGKSFLSALQARVLAEDQEIGTAPEVAFICALLHNLGRIIVCIYLPDKFQEIERLMSGGQDEDKAARLVLDEVSFEMIGQEVARFWNLSDEVISAMLKTPRRPANTNDKVAMLQNVSLFTNELTDLVCAGRDIDPLVARYTRLLGIDRKQALALVDRSVEAAEDLSGSMRYGMARLKVRSRLRFLEDGRLPDGGQISDDSSELPPLPVSRDKSLNDFIREITEILLGDFQLNDFYLNLLEGLYRGIGFDRVILAIVGITPQGKMLRGRFGLGDTVNGEINDFKLPLTENYYISRSLLNNDDCSFIGDEIQDIPAELKPLVAGRRINLLPICLQNNPIGLIYMDRIISRPELDEEQIRAIVMLRDLAVMALQKIVRK